MTQTKQRDKRRKKVSHTPVMEGLGKKRPYDHELEKVVLGALMLEKDALEAVVDILKISTFDKDSHQRIFEAILRLNTKTEPIDMMTVTNELRANGELEICGGAFAIAELTQRVNSAANIEYHTRILVQYAMKRAAIVIGDTLVKDAYDETTDVFEILDKAEQSFYDISERNTKKQTTDILPIMAEAFEEIETMKNHTDGLTGVPSGFYDFDKVTAGFQKSDLVIIAARPGMGKTAWVLSAMRNAAVEFNQGVAIFSLEMSSVQLVKRLISAEAKISSEKLKTGNLTPQEWDQLVTMTTKLQNAPIFIDDTPALSIMELRAKCRRLKAKKDLSMIIVDYMQLMTVGESQSNYKGNREQEISLISRSLKQLAKELEVPVLALSQLSRAVETRGGEKRPQLSDLRESGSIEQDADMVMFLYRPEYYGITEDEEGNSTINMGEVIIAKHRNGALKNIKMKFIKQFTYFCDFTDDYLTNNSFIGNEGLEPEDMSKTPPASEHLPANDFNDL
jgi:replicative DNA helicase